MPEPRRIDSEQFADQFTELLRRLSATQFAVQNQERVSTMPSLSSACRCHPDCHGPCCCDCNYCHSLDDYELETDDYETEYRPSDRIGSRPRLQSYSYRPRIRFHGNSLLQLGMECELSSSSTWPVARAQDILGDLACYKSDGSVDGFEMVTQPMDYEFWSTEFPWEVFTALAEEGCSVVPSTNGIHVHLSRRGFSSPAHVYRWMKLLYRNQDSVERIARRRGTSWAPFDNTHRAGQFAHVYKKPPRIPVQPEVVAITTMEEQSYRRRAGLSSRYDTSPRRSEYVAAILDMNQTASAYSLDLEYRVSPDVVRDYSNRLWAFLPAIDRYVRCTELRPLADMDAGIISTSRDYLDAWQRSQPEFGTSNDPTQRTRYAAINTTNTDTYEIRLFASTVQPHEARAAIQFCASSVEYTRHLTAHQVTTGGWSWDSYKSYVQEATDGLYPDLARAMDARINWSKATYVYPSSIQATAE